MNSRCSSCGASIRWARTEKGKAIPVDPEPVTDGNLIVDEAGVARVVGAGKGTHRSHFASCPEASQHRKVRR